MSDSPSVGSPESARPGDLSTLVAACLRSPEMLRASIGQDPSARTRLLLLVIVAMAFVGFLMAAFSGGLQVLAVPLKVIAGTIAAMSVCLPSLFVFSNLAGVQVGIRQALGTMLVAVVVLALVLVAVAPVALVFALSTESTAVVGAIHVLFLLIAARFGGAALSRIWADDGGGRSGAATWWIVLFVVVLLQLSTTLRPLIGEYQPLDLSDKKIFFEHWLGDTKN
jgi:hypothetical protein